MEEKKVEEKKEPKLVVSSIFDECQKFASDIFTRYAEPNAITFCFNWVIGNNDAPTGTMVTRQNGFTVSTVMAMISQLNKQEQHFLQLLLENIAKAQESTDGATKGSE